METQEIKILMVDDHPMIIEGYENTLQATKKDHQILNIDIATNCDEALTLINRSGHIEKPYDIFFFDISIPASFDGIYKSGEDLAKYVKNIFPKSKIVILTMFNETYRVHSIIKNINPDGFLIKSDLTSSELASAFHAILNNPPFYSGTINNMIRRSLSSELSLDELNLKILHLLSLGIKTVNLKDHIDLSQSSIEKRKKYLKEVLNIEDGKDETLVRIAKEKGYL